MFGGNYVFLGSVGLRSGSGHLLRRRVRLSVVPPTCDSGSLVLRHRLTPRGRSPRSWRGKKPASVHTVRSPAPSQAWWTRDENRVPETSKAHASLV